MGRMDMRNGSPARGHQAITDAVAHNRGFHPSDAGQPDRR